MRLAVRARSWLLAAVVLGAPGCAENAIFELTLRLPSDSTGLYAWVEAYSAPTVDESTFEMGFASALDRGLPLTAMATNEQTVSFVASGSTITQPLAIRVRFCSTATCAEDGLETPQVRYIVERAFYLGQRTTLVRNIEAVPSAPTPMTPAPVETIGRCAVRGCASGPGNPCYPADGGRHLCE